MTAFPSDPAPILERLLAVARRAPEETALRHKRRGIWDVWSWRSVVAAADRFAAGLRHHGVEAGSAVAFVGEVGPGLLIGALAARAIGAAAIPVAPDARVPALAALAEARPLRLAVIQGRDALAEWLAAGLSVTLAFDHVTPDGRSPHPAVLPIAAIRSHGALEGWADRLTAAPAAPSRRPVLWVEATTAWPDGPAAILDAWLDSGVALALPERLAAAERDRVETRPDRWIVSADRVAAAFAGIAGRLPSGGLAGRAVGRALRPVAGPRTPSARLVTALLRRRLGLSRLTSIETGGGPELAAGAEIAALFAALGAPLRGIAPATPSLPAGGTTPARQLALTGGAS